MPPVGPTDRPLNARQEQFVLRLHEHKWNATATAIAVGYSARTAPSIACRLMKDPRVKALVDKERRRLSLKFQVNKDRVLEELVCVGFVDLGDFITVDEGGTPSLDMQDLPEGATRALSEVVVETSTGETVTTTRSKVKLLGKVAALELIGRHLGMFPSRHEHTGKDGAPIEIKDDRDQLTTKMLGLLEDLDTKTREGEKAVSAISDQAAPTDGRGG